jgi:hypothetical protein
LQRGSGSGRIAACWYSTTSFTIDVSVNSTTTRTIALYFLDWDSSARVQRVDVLDVNGNVLDTHILSNFNKGQYLVWNVLGNISFRITNSAYASNAVLSGIFFGTASTTTASTAVFVKADNSTEGSWKGVYGADGYDVINDTVSFPSYVSVTPSGDNSYIWAGSTSDVRALQKVSSITDRIAACWYSNTSFSIDLAFQDGAVHQFATYLLDWDVLGRNERIDILDSAGNVLNSQVIGGFATGQYLVWNLSGHVVVRVTNLGGANAVVSGLFFH